VQKEPWLQAQLCYQLVDISFQKNQLVDKASSIWQSAFSNSSNKCKDQRKK